MSIMYLMDVLLQFVQDDHFNYFFILDSNGLPQISCSRAADPTKSWSDIRIDGWSQSSGLSFRAPVEDLPSTDAAEPTRVRL